tara:strand:- start:571 stop:906 length:336 start_codon:yes stop_codon:yes gene_type:complete
MKALSIVAVVLAGISFIIPVVGVFTAIFASVLALVSFRSQATLSGIAIGLNLINTAFFSPSILIAGGMAAVESGDDATVGAIYWTYVGIHVVALIIGGALAYFKKGEEISS